MVRDVVQQLPGGNQVKRFRAGVLIAALSVSILAVGCGRSGSDSESGSGESTEAKANANCTKEALQATEVGVTADTISVEVMADTGSPLAPGLFQGNVDAMNAYAKWINANGGVAIAVNGLTYSATPVWVTGSSLSAGTTAYIQLTATGATSYALAAGSTLPAGLSLSSAGLLSGTVSLASETTYNFTVNAIDAELQDSPRTFSLTVMVAPTVIGQAFGGGFYAGQISTTGNGVATHYLIIAPKATGQAGTGRAWKTTETATAGTSSVIDGFANSEAMNNASHPAAQFCRGLSIGGFTDWYLPSKNEIEIVYYNLRPTSVSNSTGGNTNANAVPVRSSNYSASVPGQTSATAFQSGGSEAFPPDAFWSSTESSTTDAWRQGFENGYAANIPKLSSIAVRAVRKVPI
jgi:hypothetical protein